MDMFLEVTGMSCKHCVKHTTEALQAVDGVMSAEVSLADGRAKIQVSRDPGRAAVAAALEEAGYGLGAYNE